MGHHYWECKIEKLKVKELDFYLNEHGLTTIDRKLDKVKAIWCHYYRHIKESMNTDKSCGAKDWERDVISTLWRTRATINDFVFNDLFEKSNPSQKIQFISDDQIGEVVGQGSWDVSINIHVTCLHIVTLAFCGGWDRRGGIMKSSTTNVGGSKPHCKRGSCKCSVVVTKILRPPSPRR